MSMSKRDLQEIWNEIKQDEECDFQEDFDDDLELIGLNDPIE